MNDVLNHDTVKHQGCWDTVGSPVRTGTSANSHSGTTLIGIERDDSWLRAGLLGPDPSGRTYL
jgi:hypothetical protein